MLGKIVLTLVVMLIAFLFVRQRNDAEKSKSKKTKPATPKPGQAMASELRLAAYLFLILMFGAGATMYYLRWQDDRTVLTVSLYRDGQDRPVTYQVYKFQLDSRSFITTDGVRITVASNERMEVIGLEP